MINKKKVNNISISNNIFLDKIEIIINKCEIKILFNINF